jgi:hypothetical protein
MHQPSQGHLGRSEASLLFVISRLFHTKMNFDETMVNPYLGLNEFEGF